MSWLWIIILAMLITSTMQQSGDSSGVESRIITLLEITGFNTQCITIAMSQCHNTNDYSTSCNKLDASACNQLIEGYLQLSNISPGCMSEQLAKCSSSWSPPPHFECSQKPHSCMDLLKQGDKTSGVKTIYPWKVNHYIPTTVYCDQQTDGGGWTVIQKREFSDIRENFYRTWIEYKLGFGNKSGEYWLGNDLIHEISSSELHQLRIDLEDYEGSSRWAKYSLFYVDNESNKYKLTIDGFNGTAGDGLGPQNAQKFSTKDQDNDIYDQSCAEKFKGAWWYSKCHSSNLNGYPYKGRHESYADGINWKTWRGHHQSLKLTKMMIKPAF